MTKHSRRYGAVYGTAIGDSLGLPLKGLTALQITRRYAQGTLTEYQATKKPKRHTREPGEWGAPTTQTLALLGALTSENPKGNYEQNLAHHLKKGRRPHGNQMERVLRHKGFSKHPVKTAQKIWEKGLPGKPETKLAGNGGVMRAAAAGILRPWDLEGTEQAAIRTCIVTHHDRRCVASVVAVSVTIAALIQGWPIKNAIEEGLARAVKIHAAVAPWLRNPDLGTLNLYGGDHDYTYKAMGAGFWALREIESTGQFLPTLLKVLRAGGAVGTNTAVAGALLGAAIGHKSMPRNLVYGLVEKDKLHTLVSRVCLQSPFPDTQKSFT